MRKQKRRRQQNNTVISDILGFLPSVGKVVAEDSDGNLFAGNPELVAEIANDVYLQDEPWLSVSRDSPVDAEHTRAFLSEVAQRP